jgi:hypothetical protein
MGSSYSSLTAYRIRFIERCIERLTQTAHRRISTAQAPDTPPGRQLLKIRFWERGSVFENPPDKCCTGAAEPGFY